MSAAHAYDIGVVVGAVADMLLWRLLRWLDSKRERRSRETR